MPLIEARDLGIRLQTQRGPAQAVQGVSFQIERGQALGLIGESGCGKSITAMALMGLLDSNGHIKADRMQFDGQDLLTISERARRRSRPRAARTTSTSSTSTIGSRSSRARATSSSIASGPSSGTPIWCSAISRTARSSRNPGSSPTRFEVPACRSVRCIRP